MVRFWGDLEQAFWETVFIAAVSRVSFTQALKDADNAVMARRARIPPPFDPNAGPGDK
jgi:hypothetical protein